MQMIRSIALAVVTLCFIGCISSVNPLSSPEVVEDNPGLIGVWYEERAACSPKPYSRPDAISIFRVGGGYDLVVDSLSHSKRYAAQLVRLGGHSFLDVSREPADFDSIPAHHIFRVQIGENRLVIEPIDQQNLERILRSEDAEFPVARLNNGKRLVLTGSTDQLQAFFQEHADELFGGDPFGRSANRRAVTYRHRLDLE